MSLVILASPRFAEHVTPPGHPESAERAEVLEGVALRARDRGIAVLEPRAATDDEILRVHTRAHLDRIDAARGKATMIDPDTYTSPASVDIARLACGAALMGVEQALRQGKRALVLVRPPGHHAEPERAMGFCLFGNVAAAASHALALGAARVAVVDIDVHHGNGTQAAFYGDPRVLFLSIHQYPFYPGTGAPHEVGEGAGEGFTVNVPLEGGATDGDYDVVSAGIVTPVLRQFAPDVVIVSAGFDAHEADPLAQMRLTTGGYRRLLDALVAIAEESCDGRLVVVTEGGYDLAALAGCGDAAVAALANLDGTPGSDGGRPATGRADRARAAVRAAQSARWHGL
jgi:acetoin utilization deacetylase AcuC-like enzyme